MTYANSHALNLYYFLTISFALLGRFEQGKEKLLQLAPHQGAKSVRSALECIYIFSRQMFASWMFEIYLAARRRNLKSEAKSIN
jgi:hypothetical protein